MGKLGGGETSRAAKEAAANVAVSRGVDLDRAVQREQPVEPQAPPQRAPVFPARGEYPPLPGGAPMYDPWNGRYLGGDTDTPTRGIRTIEGELARLANNGFDAGDTRISDPGPFYTPLEHSMQPLTGRQPIESASGVRDEVGEEPTTHQRDVIHRQFNGLFEPVRMYKNGALMLWNKRTQEFYYHENGEWRRQNIDGRWEQVPDVVMEGMIAGGGQDIPDDTNIHFTSPARPFATLGHDAYTGMDASTGNYNTNTPQYRQPTSSERAQYEARYNGRLRVIDVQEAPEGDVYYEDTSRNEYRERNGNLQVWREELGRSGGEWVDVSADELERLRGQDDSARLPSFSDSYWNRPYGTDNIFSPGEPTDAAIYQTSLSRPLGASSSTPDTVTSGPLGQRTSGEFDSEDPRRAKIAAERTVTLANPNLVLEEDRVQALVSHIGEVAHAFDPQQRPQEALTVDPQAVINTYQAFEDTLRALRANTDPQTQARVLRELGLPEDLNVRDLRPDTIQDTFRQLFVREVVDQLNRERRGEEMTIAQMQNEFSRLEAERDDAERTGGTQSPDYIRLRDQRLYMGMLQQDLNQAFLRFALPGLGNVSTAPVLITALDTASRDHSITNLQEVERLRQQLQGIINTDTNARAEDEEPYEIPSAEDLVRAFRSFEQGHSREGYYSVETTEVGGIKIQKLAPRRPELDTGRVEEIRNHFLEIINSRVPALVGIDLERFVGAAPPEMQGVMEEFLAAVNANEPELQAVRELFAQRTYSQRFMETARRLLDLPEPLDQSADAALAAIRAMEDASTRPTERAIMQAFLYRFVHLVGEYRARQDASDVLPIPQIALLTFSVTEGSLEDYIGERYDMTFNTPEGRENLRGLRKRIVRLRDQMDPATIAVLGGFDQSLTQVVSVGSTTNTA